jgi:hypothetical protein
MCSKGGGSGDGGGGDVVCLFVIVGEIGKEG